MLPSLERGGQPVVGVNWTLATSIALNRTRDYQSVVGTITFDDHRQNAVPLITMREPLQSPVRPLLR